MPISPQPSCDSKVNTASAPSPLVIVNVLNYGHFNSYTDNFIRWAWGRGLSVVLVGRKAREQAGRSAMLSSGALELLDIEDVCPEFDWDDADAARIAFGRGARSIVAELARRYQPLAVLLVNADEIFFNDPCLVSEDYQFKAKVWGVVTFGRRQAHFGLEDPYAWRLNWVVGQAQIFAGLFSIDERHVAEADPEQRFLRYLPDPYRDFSPACAEEMEELAKLQQFLQRSQAPVVPILGKFDHRKSNLWTLRQIAAHPAARAVVLGQRRPDPLDDASIDSILEELKLADRAYVHFGFVSQSLFEAVLSCGLVPFLPLPYRNHAGSSGPQLLGWERGIPSLVPDFGLMAERVHAHKLGLTFRLGDEADFAAKFSALLNGEVKFASAGMAAFMSLFGPKPLAEALDGILGNGSGKSFLAAARSQGEAPLWLERAEAARALLGRRELAAAKDALSEALALRPDDRGLVLLRLAVATRLGDWRLAVKDCKACLRAGLREELQFILGRLLAACPCKEEGKAAPAENYDLQLSRLIPCFSRQSISPEQLPLLMDAAWRLLDRALFSQGVLLVECLLRSFPGEPRLLLLLVHAHLRRQRFAEAEAILSAWSANLVTLPAYRLALAYVRQGQGRLEDANELLAHLLAERPEFPEYRFAMAVNLLAGDNLEASGEILDKLLGEYPRHPEYRRTRGAVWARLGNYGQALECFAGLAAEGDVSAYLNLSDCLRYAGRFDEALTALNRGRSLGACDQDTLRVKIDRIEAARRESAKKISGER